MNNSDFHILNLSAYQTPEVTENPNEEWVAYGDDNNYYKELIDAFLNSATTGSIIQGITNQIYGKGLNGYKYKKNITLDAQNSGTLGRLILGLLVNSNRKIKIIRRVERGKRRV